MRRYFFPSFARSPGGLYLPHRHSAARAPLDNLVAQQLFGDAAARVSRPHDPDEVRARRDADSATAAGSLPAAPGARIHTGPASQHAAAALGARAFTRGRDIHFGAGEYAPDTSDGRHLLSHEMSHVRHSGGDAHTVRREPGEEGNDTYDLDWVIEHYDEIYGDGKTAGGGNAGGEVYEVETYTVDEFQALTGLDPQAIPENEYTPMDSLLTAAGYGMSCPAPSMMLDLPANTTGVLWEGAHISDWARVNGEFANVRGFRSGFGRHAMSTLERNPLGRNAFGWLGRLFYPPSATATLNRGVPGTFANDWFFPYNPKASVIYRTSPNVDAAGYAQYLDNVAPSMSGETYTFSPPPEGSRSWNESFGEGGCSPATRNCVNVPMEPHRRALGLGPNEPVPFVPAENHSGRFLGPVDNAFYGDGPLPPGLGRQRIGMRMLAGGAVRVGGTVLLVYGAWNSGKRILNAEPGKERARVITEEAAGWGGGAVGGWLTGALGRAVVCAETGPAALICVAATTLIGGVIGDLGGRKLVNDAYEGLEIMADPKRFMETSAWMQVGGNPQAPCDYYRTLVMMAEVGGGQVSDDDYWFYEEHLGCQP